MDPMGLGVPLAVYPNGIYCVLLGFFGIIPNKYPLFRFCIGISNRGTLVGVHPTIPWLEAFALYVYFPITIKYMYKLDDQGR